MFTHDFSKTTKTLWMGSITCTLKLRKMGLSGYNLPQMEEVVGHAFKLTLLILYNSHPKSAIFSPRHSFSRLIWSYRGQVVQGLITKSWQNWKSDLVLTTSPKTMSLGSWRFWGDDFYSQVRYQPCSAQKPLQTVLPHILGVREIYVLNHKKLGK